MLAIGVELDGASVPSLNGKSETGAQGTADAKVERKTNADDAVRFGEIGRVVFGPVIDDDDVEVGNSALQLGESRGEGLVFVKRGNDDEHPVTIVGPVLHWL